MAVCTARWRLGFAVLVSALYGAVHLAKRLATLDLFSRGRMEIGVGTEGKRGRSPRSASIAARTARGSPRAPNG